MLLYLTIFWIICIFWGIMYSCQGASKSNIHNIAPKLVSDFYIDKRHSTSSIESLDYSDNEGTRRKNKKKFKYEIKTRWPSQESIKTRSYK